MDQWIPKDTDEKYLAENKRIYSKCERSHVKREKGTMKIGLQTALRGKGNKCEVNVERRDSDKEGKKKGKNGRDAFFKCSVRF